MGIENKVFLLCLFLWVQCALEEIADVMNGKDYKSLKEGNIPVFGTGGYMLSVNKALSYDKDAIGIGRKGTIDKPFILKAPFWTVDTLFYAIPKEEVNLNFLNNIFQKTNWKKYDESTGVPSLTKKTINKVLVYIPNQNEQTSIGKIISLLDSQRVLQQRKLAKLNKVKKALLQQMFPEQNRKIPKTRFSEFNGYWGQRKLGEVIVSEHKGKVKSSMKGGNTNYLETNYLNGGIAQKVDATADVSKNDVLILWDGSKAGTVYHGFEGALGSTLKAYVPKCRGDFLYQILEKDQDKIYQRYRTPNIPHVIKNFTEKFIVLIPNVREQEKIAEFFHDLDSLITLHQRKLDQLKQIKQFLLQNMFI